MSIVHTYRCDVCGTMKKESNNWWVVELSALGPDTLAITAFSYPQRDEKSVIHCCGVDCLARSVSRWAGKRAEANPPSEAA